MVFSYRRKRCKKQMMKNNFLEQFVKKVAEEKNIKQQKEKRRAFFQTIGRKGGLKRKESDVHSKVVSVRFTDKEYINVVSEAKKHNLKISKYLRLVITEKELKINEFRIDEILLKYNSNFSRIGNLLRHHSFSDMDEKKIILAEIETVTKMIYDYLYKKLRE